MVKLLRIMPQRAEPEVRPTCWEEGGRWGVGGKSGRKGWEEVEEEEEAVIDFVNLWYELLGACCLLCIDGLLGKDRHPYLFMSNSRIE